jgi:hypothetical protein
MRTHAHIERGQRRATCAEGFQNVIVDAVHKPHHKPLNKQKKEGKKEERGLCNNKREKHGKSENQKEKEGKRKRTWSVLL